MRTQRGLGPALGAGLTAIALLLSACAANPPPPIESTNSPKTTPAQPTRNTVVVAIDNIGVGFNPHLLSDQSPTNAAVSALVLPSPFRPVPSPTRAGGTDWVPDPSVLVSANVTSQDPFTITYQLRDDAQWSDGAPIAAEDFVYLWQQMISQPGVVDAAGYQQITNVTSAGGGKTVVVTMNGPYPAWRELFTDLLPSHLIKDSPGGFERGLAQNIPVSGAQFHIKTVDRDRDEILLERNDRFWGVAAKPDQIRMQRGGSPAQLADSMRSDDAQVATVHGGDSTKAQLAAIPGVRVGTAAQPRLLELTLNGRGGVFTDQKVRTGVLGLLDPDLLAIIAAGNSTNVAPARAQVLSPSDPGYVATAPARPTRQQALATLADAGYEAAPEPPTPPGSTTTAHPVAQIAKNGKPLSLRIGVVQDDDEALAVADTVADQWRGAGIDASVVPRPPEDLYGDDLLKGDVDAIVGWVRAGTDPATALASRFGCPAPAAPPSTPVTSVTPTASATPASSAAAQPARQPDSNLSGLCDPSLQPSIDAALHGTADVSSVIAEAEPRLWQLAATLPIAQDTTVVAAGPGVSGVSLDGPIQVGVFSGASDWSRVQQ
ncbi:ABC transporter family substrate-binding protein [Skermania sp. ID1734]|uniref:ABC transporter family substrate-binding protein n=1 Tax=Skermania sp. ID1734 TaxID=2597516 RepID=UPI00117D136B|nr:ABC transporter family substrate-binding protein [Skermania sp. ID1734]TSE01944.1 ABC transporter family substrate-binding protein [Skermania sp. ID1734]